MGEVTEPATAARHTWAVFGISAALSTVACCAAGWLIVGAFHSHRDLVIIVITVAWFRTIQLLFNATVRWPGRLAAIRVERHADYAE